MANKLKVTILQRGGLVGGKVTLEKAARFFVDRLLSPRLRNQLSLRVELRASKLGAGTCGKAFSSCRMVAGGRKEYTVMVERDMHLSGQIRTLAHEISHVEQFMRGKIRYKRFSKLSSEVLTTVWLGVKMPEMPWAQRPWEIEAQAKERELYAAWEAVERANAAPKTGPKALIDATPEEIQAYRTTGTIPHY